MSDTSTTTDTDLEPAAPAPVIRMLGGMGGFCMDDSCSLESFLEDDAPVG
jgi:hypothetical protein